MQQDTDQAIKKIKEKLGVQNTNTRANVVVSLIPCLGVLESLVPDCKHEVAQVLRTLVRIAHRCARCQSPEGLREDTHRCVKQD